MEEGLVDAAVVAGVLSPKGKASPQEEPLFKIKAAAEAFRDMRKSIAETLEVCPCVSVRVKYVRVGVCGIRSAAWGGI